MLRDLLSAWPRTHIKVLHVAALWQGLGTTGADDEAEDEDKVTVGLPLASTLGACACSSCSGTSSSCSAGAQNGKLNGSIRSHAHMGIWYEQPAC